MSKNSRRRRRRRWIRRQTAPGASPGTLAPDPEASKPVVRVLSYGADDFEEREVADLSTLRGLVGKRPVTWVHVQGLGDGAAIAALGELFGLHKLALEDVVNVHQRPKVEQYGETLFIVTRVPSRREETDTEQVALFLGGGFVVSFEERPPEVFAPVRERIRARRGRIRFEEADYLAYALLDAAVDGFFPVLERLGEQLEELEELVVGRPSPATVSRIQACKHDLLMLRRAIWPQREALAVLFRDPSPLVRPETRVYLRDCYDHTIQIMDLLETYREIGSGLMDVYLSSVSNRMNEVMKVLTIIATIFMPLSFLASLYGMNFQTDKSPWNMPELAWRYGYPFALGLMALSSLGMLLYFWRKGWLTNGSRRRSEGEP